LTTPSGSGDRAHGLAPSAPEAAWPAEAIRKSLSAQLPGFTVEVVPELDSTNSELMRRARAGHLEPVLLVAEQQSAGRGRLGRGWTSHSADSLTFSLGLRLVPADWSGLSLAVGVALAESLHADIGLKWPNDLWLRDRKLAGILIETATSAAAAEVRYAVVGVGINLAERQSEGFSTPPAWLQELLPGCQAGDVLLRLAGPLLQAIRSFEAEGFTIFKSRFDARDVLRDRPVLLGDGTAGIGRGITDIGELRVQTASGMKTITSSEVSVRPAA